MSRAWSVEFTLLASSLLAALVLGGLSGSPAWYLLAAVGLWLAWNVYNLRRLERWLRKGRSRNPPESVGIWGDVFEHYYRLQRRYYQRKKRLRRIIREFQESTAAMPDGGLVLDTQWRIAWFNEAAQQMLDLNPKIDRGQLITNLIRNPRFAEYTQHADFSLPVDIESPTEAGRWLSLRLVPYGAGQRLLLIRDVTRVKRLEAMRRDFVANASHELRSPLTVLNGYLETIRGDEQIASEWIAPLAEMQRQCRRMTALVNDLLELTRMETEEGPASREQRVDVCGLASYIVREAHALELGERDIRLECGAGIGLLGAENELYSAFSNLIFNAVRYTAEGGRIIVRCQTGDDGGVFEVADDGVGIDEKHLPFLTQRFYRVDSSRSRRQGGTGLGLAIVKHVLQRHGGRLEIESEPGQGSTFRCVFPADRVADRSRN